MLNLKIIIPIINFINEQDIEISLGEKGFVATGECWKGTESINSKSFRQLAIEVFKIDDKIILIYMELLN